MPFVSYPIELSILNLETKYTICVEVTVCLCMVDEASLLKHKRELTAIPLATLLNKNYSYTYTIPF